MKYNKIVLLSFMITIITFTQLTSAQPAYNFSTKNKKNSIQPMYDGYYDDTTQTATVFDKNNNVKQKYTQVKVVSLKKEEISNKTKEGLIKIGQLGAPISSSGSGTKYRMLYGILQS